MASRVNITFPGNLPTVEDITDLRAVPSYDLDAKAAYLAQGGAVYGDGAGGIYSFDPGSNATDNDTTIIKPIDRTPMQFGRWVLSAGSGGGQGDISVATLAELKAADAKGTVSLTETGNEGFFVWTDGDYTGQADDINIVKQDGTALSAGAWVRQTDSSISTQATLPVTGALLQRRPLGVKSSETFTITDFGVIADTDYDNPEDNTAALAAMEAELLTLSNNGAMIALDVPAGRYSYATSPNWAIQGLMIRCSPGVEFHCTGAGIVMNFDGAARSSFAGLIGMMKLTGSPIVRGNATSTDGMRLRSVHHSIIDADIRDVTVAGLRCNWTVCNEYTIRCSGNFIGGMSPIPSIGIYLDDDGDPAHVVGGCTFYNPIIEGVLSYGIWVESATRNVFVQGTSEGNGGGVYLSATASLNDFYGLDMEVNSDIDVYSVGTRNNFFSLLCTNKAEFFGTLDRVQGGVFNILTVGGSAVRTMIRDVSYASNAGAFSNTGTATQITSLYNSTTASFDSDVEYTPKQEVRVFSGGGGNDLRIASAAYLTGGLPGNTVYFKVGGAHQFYNGGILNVSFDSNAIGFFGSAPVVKPTGTPAAATDLASAIALVNALRSTILGYNLAS